MITDASNLTQMKSIQEVYLSHNLLGSLTISYQDLTETIWPHLQILDLTSNKLNDFHEILQLLNSNALRREVLRIIGVKGNQFYNWFEAFCKQINSELEHQDLIDLYSNYQCIPELANMCFGSSNNPNISNTSLS